MPIETLNLDEVFLELRALNQPVPKPAVLPSPEQVAEIETETGVQFHPDLRRFLLEASDVVFGTLEPVTVSDSGAHSHFPEVLRAAREFGVPAELIPICEDNSDFYCIDSTGTVVFWSHNGTNDETWPDLASWMKHVWIEEGKAT